MDNHTSKHPLNENQIRFRLDGHTHDGKNSALIQRVPVVPVPTIPTEPVQFLYTMSGSLFTSISPRYYFFKQYTSLTNWGFALDNIGTTQTVLKLLRDGTLIDTLTLDPSLLPTGVNYVLGGGFAQSVLCVGFQPYTDTAPSPLPSFVQVQVDTVGSGAMDLTAWAYGG